ncbi:3-oxoacyl-[acyl-carrier-protein] synthase 2 [bacterium BMS3Bbin06]|nr:3-oxoacyl-[acyl-carrier-protein] synthase 2 [bacterium BMS3Bbin06]HDY71500.1 hypothetical protein [Nitrospirota bacterium]
MSGREVVITGMGMMTPAGKDIHKSWESLKDKRTGISRNAAEGIPDVFLFRGVVGDFQLPREMPRKLFSQSKFLNRGSTLGFMASLEAMSHAGLPLEDIEPGRRALYVGSGDFTMVGCEFMYPAVRDAVDKHFRELDYHKLNTSTLNKVNPFFLLESLSNNLFSFLSAYFEFMGPNTSLASLSPCGANAIELSVRSIKQGHADVALAVGCGNWITEVVLYELAGLGLLSKCRRGVNSYRPFDKERDGFITGEGGAALVLEASDHAEKRGAEILASVKGIGNSIEFNPGSGLSVPPHVNSESIKGALKEAGADMSDIAFICSHGSGTGKGDRTELESVVDVSGEKASDIPICGLKPYTGHLGAASDIAEVIFSVLALKEQFVPATLNFNGADREFRALRIMNEHQPCSGDRFLSISYGIGGQSSSLLIEVNR